MLQKAFDKLRLLKHFFSSARRRGVVRTLKISFYEVWFERKFGVATGYVIPLERLDYDEEARSHAEPYFPSSYLFLHEALGAGPVECQWPGVCRLWLRNGRVRSCMHRTCHLNALSA